MKEMPFFKEAKNVKSLYTSLGIIYGVSNRYTCYIFFFILINSKNLSAGTNNSKRLIDTLFNIIQTKA